jgi:hypothetical protein
LWHYLFKKKYVMLILHQSAPLRTCNWEKWFCKIWTLAKIFLPITHSYALRVFGLGGRWGRGKRIRMNGSVCAGEGHTDIS